MSSIGPLPRLSLISVGSVLVLGSLGVYSYNQEYDRITREMQARGSESLARLSKTLPPPSSMPTPSMNTTSWSPMRSF